MEVVHPEIILPPPPSSPLSPPPPPPPQSPPLLLPSLSPPFMWLPPPSTSSPSPPPPSFNPEIEDSVDDVERSLILKKLYRAAMLGDWEAARMIFERDQHAKTARLNPTGATALHVAARCGQSEFVERLVNTVLTAEELKIQDERRTTALHQVALASSVKAAKAIVSKNPDLPHLKDDNSFTPFFYAARWRHPLKNKDMLEYLDGVTDMRLLCSLPSAPELFIALNASGSYEICLRLLKLNPELAVATNSLGWSMLHFLAAKPSAFVSGSKLSLWERLIYPWVNVSERQQRHSDSLKIVHFICDELQRRSDSVVNEYFFPRLRPPILHIAVEHGVFEVVEVCLNYFPDLIWQESREGKHLLHAAVEHRRVRIFDHIIRLVGGNTGAYSEVEFEGENNILHLAAKLAPWRQLHSVPGPAFQIQRELQWFKAVDALVFDEQRMVKNNEGSTPQELFFKQHEALLSSAKEWMKDTSNSCMLVATLVTTVAFAAMITVPGGNNNETGLPILSNKRLFMAFSISNAVSMISAAMSLLMFLSVQTSRYTEEDFLESLPKTLLKGLLSLFVAVATMMIAFGTALGMAFQTRIKWAYIPITIVACIPAIIFTRLHLPLLFQTFLFTSGPGIFRGRRDPKFWWLKRFSYRFLIGDHDHVHMA